MRATHCETFRSWQSSVCTSLRGAKRRGNPVYTRHCEIFARKSWQSIYSVIAFLPTDDIKIFESVPEMRQFLFDNIKGIISDAYKDFQQEKKSK